MRGILGLPLALVMIAASACDVSLGSLAGPETGSEGEVPTTEGDGDGDHGEPFACIGGQLCPAGRSCSNGLCRIECGGDSNCATDDYCGKDGLCHPKSVPSCNSNHDCAATQTCVHQVCTAVGESCSLDNFPHDGCASNAVCVGDFDDEYGTCYELSACPADKTCPVGLIGAVCNDEYLPNKDPICLIGLCATNAHCPNLWSCVRFNNEVLGECSDGGFGAPCTISGHCISGNCVPLPGIGGGWCE